MKNYIIFLFFALVMLLSSSCGDKNKWQKSPVDELIKKLDKVESYSIVLFDMDLEDGFSDTYKHQYKIIKTINDKPEEETTGWYEVSQEFFEQNTKNMGMEIAAKSKDGKITKQVAPPGYSNYVGNTHYGSWMSDGSGGHFWQFFAQYAMMSSMLHLMTAPIYRSQWNDYRSNYYGRQSYYGQGGTQWNSAASKESSFARRTRNNANLRNSSNSGGSNFWSSKSSRSGSRWNSGSSFRSRGGGFGK